MRKAMLIVSVVNLFLWIVILVLTLTGCATIAYIRIGPQKVKRVTIIMEEQEADPNIPSGLIKVGALNL